MIKALFANRQHHEFKVSSNVNSITGQIINLRLHFLLTKEFPTKADKPKHSKEAQRIKMKKDELKRERRRNR